MFSPTDIELIINPLNMKRSSISTDKSGGREVSAGDSSTTDRAVEAASRRQNQEVATLTNNARNLQSYSEE